MESLVLFLFATAGATNIVVFSKIFEPFRQLFWQDKDTVESIETGQMRGSLKFRVVMFFSQLFHCPVCFGFWMGAVMYLFIFGIESYSGFFHFAGACAGSTASYLFYHIIKD